MSDQTPHDGALAHVHITAITPATVELSPPHAPRVETATFRKSRKFLIDAQGKGCEICGVTAATLGDPAKNPFGAKALEAHHFPIEFSMQDCVDPLLVHRDYPEVMDRATLAAFVDSPRNLKIYCDVHHRSLTYGIHHLVPEVFFIQRYLMPGYQIAASQTDAIAVEAKDETIEQAAGLEPAPAAEKEAA